MSNLVAATGGYHVIKPLQYVEETAFATTPSSASFSWIGIVDTLSPVADMSAIEFRKVGSEDLTDLAKGIEQYTTSIEYSLQNTNFLKYGTQAQGGGTQTPDRSLSLVFSIRLNNTENYVKLLGTRINSTKVSGKAGEPHKVSMELFSNDITPASTNVNIGGTVVYTSDPGTAPWIFSNGGNNPVSINSNPLAVTEIEVDTGRNAERIFTLGSSKVQYLPVKNREVKGSFTVVWTSTGSYADLTNFVARSMQWILTSGSSINLGSVNLTKLDSFAIKPEDIVYEKFSYTARTLSVSG